MNEQKSGAHETEMSQSRKGPSNGPKRPRIDWADPRIPVGNAPPLPRWPLAVAGLAWVAWVAFLVVMMLSRAQAVTA